MKLRGKQHGIVIVAVGLLPFILVYALPWAAWRGRLVATGLGISVLDIWIIYCAMSADIMGEGGKLEHPRFDRIRGAVEIAVRLFMGGLGVMFFFYLVGPYYLDAYEILRGSPPPTAEGRVTDSANALKVLIIVYQRVDVTSSAVNLPRSLYQFYSFPVLKVGYTYDFTFLPRSHCVLNAEISTQ